MIQISKHKHTAGFTVIEIMVAIVFLAAATILLMVQRGNLETAQRDDQRKVAINAMYYSLEEVFFAKNGYYPSTIDSKTLRSVDPTLFTDPQGVKLGDASSDYRYEPTGCDSSNHCTGYSLRADLEKEADYIKHNR
jgi:type II secretory pathway pseudopilin PulG